MPAERRPKSVVIIATFLFAATAMAVVVAGSLLFPGPLLDWLSQFNKPGVAVFQRLGRLSGVFLLMLAVGTLAAGIGLLRQRRWAWWFALALFVINGCGDLVSFFTTRDAAKSFSGVAVCSAFLYALGRRSTRLYFNAKRAS